MRRWFLGCLFFVALRALFSFVSSSDELPCFVYFGSRSAVRQAVYSVDAVGTGQTGFAGSPVPVVCASLLG